MEVHIQNFKCHSTLSVNLGNGITTFVAPNGKGKSSFVEAVAWCIFGPHAINASQDRIVRRGEKKCSVRVDMPIAGEIHTFTRSYTLGGAAEAQVHIGERLVGNGPAGVAEYLQEKGIDLDGFNMVYAQQGELAYFVDAAPAIRKQLISSLLQLDKFDDMLKQIRSDVKEQEEKLYDIPDRELIEELVGQLDELRREVEQATGEIAMLDNIMVEKEGVVNLLRDKLTDPYEQEMREQIISKVAAFDALHGRHLEERKKWLKASKAHRHFSPDKSLEEVEKEVDKTKNQCAALAADINGLQMHVESIFVLMSEVEKGTCPVCTQAVENPEELVQGTLHDNVSDLEDRIREKQAALKFAKGTLQRQEKIAADVLSDTLAQEAHLREVANAKVQLKICNEQIEEVKKTFLRLHGELEELGDAPEDVRGALEEAEKELGSLRKQQTASIAAKRIAQHKLEAVEVHGEELAEKLRGSELQRRKLGVLKELQKSMPSFRDAVLAQALAWVAERATGLLLRATGDPWPLRIDTDLGFWVGEIPLEDFSSGQIDMVCVCLRIAVAEFLSKRIGMKGLMILDGVFDRIDEDNRDAIGRLVGEINVPQILLLSHFEVPVIEGERFVF